MRQFIEALWPGAVDGATALQTVGIKGWDALLACEPVKRLTPDQ